MAQAAHDDHLVKIYEVLFQVGQPARRLPLRGVHSLGRRCCSAGPFMRAAHWCARGTSRCGVGAFCLCERSPCAHACMHARFGSMPVRSNFSTVACACACRQEMHPTAEIQMIRCHHWLQKSTHLAHPSTGIPPVPAAAPGRLLSLHYSFPGIEIHEPAAAVPAPAPLLPAPSLLPVPLLVLPRA